MIRLFVLFLPIMLSAETHVLYVSALIEDQYELRKKEYLASLDALFSYNIEPWIIEATNIKQSFFDNLVKNVLYPNVNDPNLKNQGVNEAMSIINCLNLLPFDDEDMVIKLTGRYKLYQNDLLLAIQKHPECDAILKWTYNPKQAFTGIFGMKWKYFKQMFLSWDLDNMEKGMINFEMMVGDYIQDSQLRCITPEILYLEARIYARGKGVTIHYL